MKKTLLFLRDLFKLITILAAGSIVAFAIMMGFIFLGVMLGQVKPSGSSIEVAFRWIIVHPWSLIPLAVIVILGYYFANQKKFWEWWGNYCDRHLVYKGKVRP